MESKIRILGVVVLYNPDESIINNISLFINQIDSLIIFDNSTKDNSSLLKNILSPRVRYIANKKNLGVAAALNYSVKIGLSEEFTFLFTIDQDSRVPPNMVERLIDFFSISNRIAIVSPFHLNVIGNKYPSNLDYEFVDSVMTSGNLISLQIFKIIGEFDEKLFIDYVDIEYCFRIKKNGFLIVQVNLISLLHNEGNVNPKKIFTKTFFPYNFTPIRYFYKTRNLLYLGSKYFSYSPRLVFFATRHFLRCVFKMLLFENYKLKKILMIFLGGIAFIKGDMYEYKFIKNKRPTENQ